MAASVVIARSMDVLIRALGRLYANGHCTATCNLDSI